MSRGVLLSCLLTLAGCVGARVSIRADSVVAPVSLSGYLLVDGRVIPPSQLTRRGRFHNEQIGVAVGYSWLSLPGAIDVSREIDDAVKAVAGDGVVNLEMAVHDCLLNIAMVLTVLLPLTPVAPGCVSVELNGDIVSILPPNTARPVQEGVETPKGPWP